MIPYVYTLLLKPFNRKQIVSYLSTTIHAEFRDEAKKSTDEPSRKRMKLFPKAGNPPDSDDLDLGTWIGNAEERCNRVGELKTRMENEKKSILAWMEGKMKEDDGIVPEG